MIAARILCVVLLLANAFAAPAQIPSRPSGIGISSKNPAYFRFVRDPQAICFLPGNAGSSAFGESPEEVSAAFGTASDELRCDGLIATLDDPEYRFRVPVGSGKEDHTRLWQDRLVLLLRQARDGFKAVDLRAGNSLLDRLRTGGKTAVPEFARLLSSAIRAADYSPMISFETPAPRNESVMLELRDALRREAPAALLGRVAEEAPPDSSHAPGQRRGWDYVVVRPDLLLPEWQRGQAAMQALRSRFGNVPIVLRLKKPDFYADIVHLATGAAGFQYDAFPARPGPDRDRRFRSLRAFAAMKSRLRDTKVRLMPEHSRDGAYGAFGVDGESYCLLLPRGAQARFRMPALPDRPAFSSFWYRPATDETILRPLDAGRTPGSSELTLSPPEPHGAWIYCWSPLPSDSLSNPER